MFRLGYETLITKQLQRRKLFTGQSSSCCSKDFEPFRRYTSLCTINCFPANWKTQISHSKVNYILKIEFTKTMWNWILITSIDINIGLLLSIVNGFTSSCSGLVQKALNAKSKRSYFIENTREKQGDKWSHVIISDNLSVTFNFV